MKRNWIFGLAIVVSAIALISMGINAQTPVATPAANLQPLAAPPADADRAAILKSATDFAEAFNKGDAKAIAAMWTDNGESRTVNGPTFVGKAAIEKAYGELFKAYPGAKIEVLVKSIRFPRE